MSRIRYALCSTKGYLSDIETYVSDPEEAVTFSCFDVAVQKLNTLRPLLKNSCRVTEVRIPFPLTKPFILNGYSNKH
jgi:hypothetical protein